MAKDIKVTELRQKLPEYLARVRAAAARARLKGSVLRYDHPLDPVIAPAEWEMNR